MYCEKYIYEMYKEYLENSKKTAEQESASKKLAEKYAEIQKKFTEDQLQKIDEFERCISNLFQIEVKEAFKAGFKEGCEQTTEDLKNNNKN